MKSLFLTLAFLASVTVHSAAEKPNIIYILADDLGYGDVHALNPEHCKIATPGMDQLAEQGMVFTDAHSSSSVCTPTRYGVMTGRYNWRSKLQRAVTHGLDQPLIPKDRLTVASFLKKQGYKTVMIGKWHLGLGIKTPNGNPTSGRGTPQSKVDWKARIDGGPVDLGFDSWYGTAASLDMPPYVFIDDDHFVGEGSVIKEFYPKRIGPAHPDFEADEMLDILTRKSTEFIGEQSGDQPFFMYIPLTSPHTPLLPLPKWQGKSEIGVYGDFVMQTDDVIRQITAAVDAAGLTENTMIIVTSDNGCSKTADGERGGKGGVEYLKELGHYANGQYRGAKSDIWDGGHRVPFIVRWPAGIKAGSSSDEIICLTDLMATCAELTGAELPDDAGEDSVSFAPAFEGKPIKSTRKGVVHHSVSGQFAYREGKWKILLTRGSGGWSKDDMADNSPAQLYDMEADPGERNNLYKTHPEVFGRLLAQLESDVKRGRSTAGVEQKNDTEVNFLKGMKRSRK